MNPPRAAEWVLLAMAGESEAEFVAGDLAEDFGYLFAQRGRGPARRWYAWQVARSAPALITLRVRSGELTGAVLRATLGVLLPLAVLDWLWRFVYSQIPLKDGLERSPAMLAANVLLVAFCSWMLQCDGARRRVGSEAVAAMTAVALGVYTAEGEAPLVYVVCLLLAAPAHSLWITLRRKWR